MILDYSNNYLTIIYNNKEKRDEKQRIIDEEEERFYAKSCVRKAWKKNFLLPPSLFFHCTISLMVKDIHGLKLNGER